MLSEDTLWEDSPSQIMNLRTYIICFLGSFLVVPFFYALYKYIETNSIKYELSSERIFIHSGIFTRNVEEIELYRIKDYTLHQPFFLRLFQLSVLTITTNDETSPTLLLNSIAQGDEVRNMIRIRVEQLRIEKHIREWM